MKILFFLSIAICFFGCTKEDISDCSKFQSFHITSNSPVREGETIKFSVPEVGGYRIYTWNGPNNYNNQYPSDSIPGAQLQNEGWYYANVSKEECGSRTDSVYIDVLIDQGTPPCTTPANTCSFTLISDNTFNTVQKLQDASGLLLLRAGDNGSHTDLDVLFHPHWKNTEPEDGIYLTTNVPVFDQFDANYNKLFISTVKESIYWASHPGQLVYVSHINGKLQVRFCDLIMSGSNGQSYTTHVDGNLIQQ